MDRLLDLLAARKGPPSELVTMRSLVNHALVARPLAASMAAADAHGTATFFALIVSALMLVQRVIPIPCCAIVGEERRPHYFPAFCVVLPYSSKSVIDGHTISS